jgi:hypothetical protein
MEKEIKQNCRKCGAVQNLHYVPSSGMDIGTTGLHAICPRCGFTERIQSLDEKE